MDHLTDIIAFVAHSRIMQRARIGALLWFAFAWHVSSVGIKRRLADAEWLASESTTDSASATSSELVRRGGLRQRLAATDSGPAESTNPLNQYLKNNGQRGI